MLRPSSTVLEGAHPFFLFSVSERERFLLFSDYLGLKWIHGPLFRQNRSGA